MRLEKERGHDWLGMKIVNFLFGSVCAFHLSMTHVSLASFWEEQRDPTKFLTDSEFTALDTNMRLFYVSIDQMLTLYDGLMGAGSNSNPVRTLFSTKADREGYSSDLLANALFCITLMLHFHKWASQQVDTVAQLIRSVQECQSESLSRFAIFTADREYGRERFFQVIEKGEAVGFSICDARSCSFK